MLRAATLSDVPALVALGERMHAESPRFSRLAFAADKVRAMLEAAIAQAPRMLVLVAERDGEIIGGLVAVVGEHWCSTDLVATDIALFVTPGARGGAHAALLVRRYVEWARSQGAKLIQLGITTGVNTTETERLYEALGLTRCGAVYEAI